MAFVEAPVVHHRQPGAIHFVQAVPQGAGRTLEHAGIGHVKFVTLCLEQATCVLGLFHASGGQVNVGSAGEAVFEVPGGFAMANENEFVHGQQWGGWGNLPCNPRRKRNILEWRAIAFASAK